MKKQGFLWTGSCVENENKSQAEHTVPRGKGVEAIIVNFDMARVVIITSSPQKAYSTSEPDSR